MEKIIHNTSLHNFLDGITAAVIGLIALTAIQLFRTTIIDFYTVFLFSIALFILFRFKKKFIPVSVILGAGFIGFILFYA
jgi:chromate transporter